MLYRTGYKKAHYRHLPVVLTHSTHEKMFLLGSTGVTKIVTVFCPLRCRMTLCLKSDDSAHLSYRFEYLRRFPLNVRAVSAKIKLPKKYLQHCHILRTDKKNLSLLLLPS